jgi:thiol:disulfide interchange protein DsbA
MTEAHSPSPRLATRRRLLSAAPVLGAAAWGLAPASALAQAAPFKAGAEYKLVDPPQPPAVPGKIDVIEFFWYGCIHCAHFEPTMERWTKAIPADVNFRRVPVAFEADREPHSRIYFALEAMGLLNQFHAKMFQTIAVERQKLNTPDAIADYMAKNGVDRQKWLSYYNAFSIPPRLKTARQIVEAYRIDGTPAIGVAGRYYTSPADANGADRAIQVVDYLIAQTRKGGAR